MAGTIHWLDQIKQGTRRDSDHPNYPRISADTIVKLVKLRNKISGKNDSIYTASQAQTEEKL